jgi:hypothetical protein
MNAKNAGLAPLTTSPSGVSVCLLSRAHQKDLPELAL